VQVPIASTGIEGETGEQSKPAPPFGHVVPSTLQAGDKPAGHEAMQMVVGNAPAPAPMRQHAGVAEAAPPQSSGLPHARNPPPCAVQAACVAQMPQTVPAMLTRQQISDAPAHVSGQLPSSPVVSPPSSPAASSPPPLLLLPPPAFPLLLPDPLPLPAPLLLAPLPLPAPLLLAPLPLPIPLPLPVPLLPPVPPPALLPLLAASPALVLVPPEVAHAESAAARVPTDRVNKTLIDPMKDLQIGERAGRPFCSPTSHFLS
jgi:hypothetical protein